MSAIVDAKDEKKDNTKAVEEQKPKSVLELLEEDDEFEEFEGATWDNAATAAEDGQLWQDDWEDEDVNDDFVDQLRVQIEMATAEVTASKAAAASS